MGAELGREENKELVREDDRRLVGSMHIFRYAEENLPERYEARITNALAEGTNSKIEWIKNTARGHRNWDNRKPAILFHCGRLDLTNVSLRPA